MGKKPSARRPVDAAESRFSMLITGSIVAAALAVVFFFWSRYQSSSAPVPTPAPADLGASSEGLGPKTMQAQQPLVSRILELLAEIEQFKGGEHADARREASARLEKELDEIEAKLNSEDSVDKQSVALISVVRSALHADRDGWKDEDWNDETLVKQHGFVTYASQTYWDKAYADNKYGESYDWYGAWTEKAISGVSLGDVVGPLLDKESKILIMGCGNSNMSVTMHDDGYRQITNTDISEPVIDQMKKSYGHIDGLSWHAMDASAMSLADGSFDAIIEKGLFDALFAGTGALTEKVLAEAGRVLRPGGSLLSITFSRERLNSLVNASATWLSCAVQGDLQYENSKSTHQDAKPGQTIFVFKCERA